MYVHDMSICLSVCFSVCLSFLSKSLAFTTGLQGTHFIMYGSIYRSACIECQSIRLVYYFMHACERVCLKNVYMN